MADKNYIYYKGEKLTFEQWITMHDKAKALGFGEAYVRQLVHRTKAGKGKKTIDFREIPELSITLVKK